MPSLQIQNRSDEALTIALVKNRADGRLRSDLAVGAKRVTVIEAEARGTGAVGCIHPKCPASDLQHVAPLHPTTTRSGSPIAGLVQLSRVHNGYYRRANLSEQMSSSICTNPKT